MQRVPSCAYCFKPYAFKGSGRPVGQRIPRLLSCGHTFCDRCVSKLVDNPLELECALLCPTCKKETALPSGKKHIKNLPTNLYILGILINNVRATIEKDIAEGDMSDFDLEKCFINASTPSTRGGPPLGEDIGKVCDECSSNAAVSKCRKCDAVFCEKCFDTVHSSSRTLRSHEAVPLGLTHLVEMSAQTCETHKGRELEFYDQTEEKLICSLCIVTPAHQGHKIVPAHELTEEVAEKVKQSLESVKRVHAHLQKSKGKLSSLFPEIKTEYSEVVQEIREHFQDLHTKLQVREVDLIKEVKDAYCSKGFLAEVAQEIIQQSKELGTLIQQGTAALSVPSLIMKIGETLLSNMADFEDAPCILSESFVQDLVKISYPEEFQDTLNSYGNIDSGSCSIKLKKITEQPDNASVEAEDTTDVASTDTCNKSRDDPKVNTVGTLLTMPSRQNLVYVAHVKNPSDFFVQHVADAERIENLMDAINNYCKAAKSLNDAVKSTQVGDLVCAQYSVDQVWYRARVIGEQQQDSIPNGRNQPLPAVEVSFVDYGNTEVVPLNRLRRIRPEFSDFPDLATNCSLIDIVPPGQCKTWPAQSSKAFGSLSSGKSLLMSVIKKSGGKLFVDLKSPEEEPIKDDNKPASVRDALVFLEVAHFRSPASDADPTVAFPTRTYKKVEVPEEGETIEVTVTYTEAPDVVYVIKEYADTLRIIQQMFAMYSTTKGNQWQIVWPYKGLVCAARFSGDLVWYRALVTDVTPDQKVQVLYVDFGNSEMLHVSEIRRIPDHLTQLPMQAMKCCLAGILPVDEEKGWSDECCNFLADTCTLNKYNMRVVEAQDNMPMAVVLCQADVRMSVNQQLVLNSYAALSSSYDADSLGIVNPEEPTSPASSVSTRVDDADDATSSVNSEQGKLLYKPKLLYQSVEMPKANKFRFAVSYVDNDCTISGCPPDYVDYSLPELMNHMQKICKGSHSLVTQDQLSPNQPCCAEYAEDNMWYRAQIVSFPTSSSVVVDYVDFGNRAEIPLTSVSLNAAFLDIPKQCLSVQLDGLPKTSVERAKVAEVLEGLLVGNMCEAVTSSTISTVNGVINVDHLTLPDGRDVLTTAWEMMANQREEMATQHEEQEEIQEHDKQQEIHEKPDANQQPTHSPSVKTQKDNSRMTKRMIPAVGKSLLTDTVLPPEGIPFDVSVTQINTKSVLFLQRDPPRQDSPGLAVGHDPTHIIALDHINQMLDISNKINLANYFNGKPNVSNVWRNMLCCARYTEDDLWYRAQVTQVVSNSPLQARVLYVDYGTAEVIELDRIKPFPAELVRLPKQAFQSCVVGLGESSDQDGESGDQDGESGDQDGDEAESDDDQESIDFLANVLADKKLICKVVSSGPPVVVELYDRVFNEESYQDVPIGQRLSELELIMDLENVNESDDALSENELNTKGGRSSPEEKTSTAKEGTSSPKEEKPSPKEDKSAGEKKCWGDDDPTEDFTVDVKPVGDWHSDCEEPFVRYDREGRSTRPQLLTPAQFLLKKEGSAEHEKATKNTAQAESEVD